MTPSTAFGENPDFAEIALFRHHLAEGPFAETVNDRRAVPHDVAEFFCVVVFSVWAESI